MAISITKDDWQNDGRDDLIIKDGEYDYQVIDVKETQAKSSGSPQVILELQFNTPFGKLLLSHYVTFGGNKFNRPKAEDFFKAFAPELLQKAEFSLDGEKYVGFKGKAFLVKESERTDHNTGKTYKARMGINRFVGRAVADPSFKRAERQPATADESNPF